MPPTPQEATSMPPNSQTPALNMPVQPVVSEKKSERPGGGERVIQPIHDPRIQQQRENIAKRMNELLGDEEFERTQVNTNTAKHLRTQKNVQVAPMTSIANTATAQTAPAIPMSSVAAALTQTQMPTQQMTPQTSQTSQQQMPSSVTPQVPSGQAIYQQMMRQQAQANNAAQNVIAQMQAPIPAAQQQAATQPSIDPRAAALKLQELQAQEMPQIVIPKAPVAQAPAPVPAQAPASAPTAAPAPSPVATPIAPAAAQPAAPMTPPVAPATPVATTTPTMAVTPTTPVTTPTPPRPHTSLRANPEIVKKAAAASILMKQKTAATAPSPFAKEPPVQAIQPAYIQNLETELAADMQTAQNDNSLSSRMAAELANDQITLEASKLKAEQPVTPAKQTQATVDNTPKAVLDAMQSAMPSPNLESNPNFKHE